MDSPLGRPTFGSFGERRANGHARHARCTRFGRGRAGPRRELRAAERRERPGPRGPPAAEFVLSGRPSFCFSAGGPRTKNAPPHLAASEPAAELPTSPAPITERPAADRLNVSVTVTRPWSWRRGLVLRTATLPAARRSGRRLAPINPLVTHFGNNLWSATNPALPHIGEGMHGETR